MPKPWIAGALAAVALAGPIGAARAGSDNVSARCIASSDAGGRYTLRNRCRFGVDLRYCSQADPKARCGERLGMSPLAAGATLHLTLPAGDRLRYAACPAGDEIELKWLNLRGRTATGFALECLSVGD